MAVSKENIQQVFKEKIAEISSNVISAEEVIPGSSLSVDYGMDSISTISLILEMEDALNICFDDDDFENIDFFSYDQVLNRIIEKVEAVNG